MSASAESAEILSLKDLKISLPQDVYDHLATQYSVLDKTTTSATRCTPSHIDNILERMKSSPGDTCCRVNLIQSSVDEVVDGLRDHISNIESQSNEW